MILFKQIELLERLHKRINESSTGTPKEFAKRLCISEQYLYEIISEMKDMGAPIEYSRKNNTYYYTKQFEIDISCSLKCISIKEQRNTSAGQSNLSVFVFTAGFMQ
jgi:hypothetical protein